MAEKNDKGKHIKKDPKDELPSPPKPSKIVRRSPERIEHFGISESDKKRIAPTRKGQKENAGKSNKAAGKEKDKGD